MEIGQYCERLSRDIPSAGCPWFWQWAEDGPFFWAAILSPLLPAPLKRLHCFASAGLLLFGLSLGNRDAENEALTDNSPLVGRP